MNYKLKITLKEHKLKNIIIITLFK